MTDWQLISAAGSLSIIGFAIWATVNAVRDWQARIGDCFEPTIAKDS